MTIINVPNLAAGFAPDAPPTTLRWFRNGIAPPAPGAAKLADRLNLLMAQRMRQQFAKAAVYGQNSDFDSGTLADLTAYRFICFTGPLTTTIRFFWAMLPTSQTPASTPYAQVVMTGGLTGSGSVTTQPKVFFVRQGTESDAGSLFWLIQDVAVSPANFYRFEVHFVNGARPVSCSAWEVPKYTIDSNVTPNVIDPAPYFQGGPILDTNLTPIINAADDIWKSGHPLFWYCQDFPANSISTTSATAANPFDASTVPSATSGGYKISVPYSGSWSSSSVPVIFWCYAAIAAGGSGNLIFKDQNANILGTIPVINTTADWLSVTGNLTDSSGSPETTQVDVYLQSDGTHKLNVEAFGCFMHDGSDILTVPPLSWLGARPRYVGSVSEVMTAR